MFAMIQPAPWMRPGRANQLRKFYTYTNPGGFHPASVARCEVPLEGGGVPARSALVTLCDLWKCRLPGSNAR